MITKRFHCALALCAGAAITPLAHADFIYQLDDGSPENAAAPGSGKGTIANGYQAVDGAGTIVAIEARLYALSAKNYTVTASVWVDPNGGSYEDATLLTSTQDSFFLSGDGFVQFTLDTPANVGSAGSRFYLGLTINSSSLLVAVDTGSSGSYLISGSSSVPADMHNFSFFPAGAAFIRGIGVPAPAAPALLGLGSFIALHRRRR